MYFALKHLHVLCAAISIIGFIVRGALRIANSPVLQKKWIRIAPHVVDTLLILSAIGLTLIIHQYPLTSAWLSAKHRTCIRSLHVTAWWASLRQR